MEKFVILLQFHIWQYANCGYRKEKRGKSIADDTTFPKASQSKLRFLCKAFWAPVWRHRQQPQSSLDVTGRNFGLEKGSGKFACIGDVGQVGVAHRVLLFIWETNIACGKWKFQNVYTNLKIVYSYERQGITHTQID